MSKPKAPKVKLPYASTIASYAKDQGGAIGNSFLGSLFRKGAVGSTPRPSMMANGAGQGMLK